MISNAFVDELKRIKPNVWDVYKKYLPNKEPLEHYAMIRDYPERQGKYFRAGLVLLGNELYGGENEDVLLLAAIMQASEDWLLIHDDIEDHSEERRSTKEAYKPTLNSLYGDELAINAGDALHAIMWKMLADVVKKSQDGNDWKFFDVMQDVILTTIEGQYQELMWIRKGEMEITEENYLKMIDKKAGYYTVIAPLSLGAMSAGASDIELNRIKLWGVNFGRAFQIWDDVMNLTIAGEIQGKENAGDIYEGKRTLVLIHLFTHCTQQEGAYISNIYSLERKLKTKKQIKYILDAMHSYGSIDYAKNKAKEYAQKSVKDFEEMYKDNNSRAKDLIKSGMEFVVNRER